MGFSFEVQCWTFFGAQSAVQNPRAYLSAALSWGTDWWHCLGVSLFSVPGPPSSRAETTVEFKNDYVLGFIIFEIFTVISLQDWVR